MRILHTSDWHIGNRLMGRSREDEFRRFFGWLLGVIRQEGVEALLLSGDVFDTSTPGDIARGVYCDFLGQAYGAGCRQIIVTAGNHDGVSNLSAEAPLLGLLGSRVVAHLGREDAADCLVCLNDAAGKPAALVCAVPYLRPQAVSLRVPVEDAAARAHAYADGVVAFYAEVARQAEAWKAGHPGLPVIAMGHLALGGVEPTASTRSLSGGLDVVPEAAFPSVFDYVALGHIHRCVSGSNPRIRYCGSPLPMGKDEAACERKVLLLDTAGRGLAVQEIAVPPFTLYENATCGDMAGLERLMEEWHARSLAAGGLPVCVELTYTGTDASLRSLYEYFAEQGPAHGVVHQRISRGRTADAPAQTEAENRLGLRELGEDYLFRRRMEEWSAGREADPARRARLESLFRQASSEAHAGLTEE